MIFQVCVEIVEWVDFDCFMGIMVVLISVCEGLFVFFVFNVEVVCVFWVIKEYMIVEMWLQWWCDVLGEIDKGGLVCSYEVIILLVVMIVGVVILIKVLDELIIV